MEIFLTKYFVSGKTPRIRNQLSVCQQLMVQLSTQSPYDEFSDIVDSSGLPHKLLQILTLGAASGSIPKFHRHIHPNKVNRMSCEESAMFC